jgi:DNA-binding LacI/PurR family transcriptional regulator
MRLWSPCGRAGRARPDAHGVRAAATMVEPELTTMRNPIEQTALEALRVLDDQIARRAHAPMQLTLRSELVKRSSV